MPFQSPYEMNNTIEYKEENEGLRTLFFSYGDFYEDVSMMTARISGQRFLGLYIDFSRSQGERPSHGRYNIIIAAGSYIPS
jgi:hypothetical protein